MSIFLNKFRFVTFYIVANDENVSPQDKDSEPKMEQANETTIKTENLSEASEYSHGKN